MAWNEIAPGIVQGVFEITMGKKDDVLNPNGITWRPVAETHDLAQYASPVLTGASTIVSVASLGVAIDSNIRIRHIQQQLNRMESKLITMDSNINRVYEKIKAVQIKSEEAHLREALNFAMKNAISNDYYINLDAISNLESDLDSFRSAMESPFQKITLASDMRIKLQAIFQLLLGLRISVATVANHSPGIAGTQFGVDQYQHLPLHGRDQFVNGIYLNVVSQVMKKKLTSVAREWVDSTFSFSRKEDQERIASIIQEMAPAIAPETTESFREMLENSGLLNYEKINSEENLSELAQFLRSSVNKWSLSDSGLVYRLHQELVAVKSGYQNYWDENPLLLIESNQGKGDLKLLASAYNDQEKAS